MRATDAGTWTGLRRALVALVVAPLAYLVALPVLLLGAPLWVVGGLSRALAAGLRRLEPRAVPWEELMAFEPDVGWMPRPGLDVVAEHAVRFRLTTDASGWRDRSTSIEDAPLIVIGDSFAFGMAIDERDFFGRRAAVPVKGIGAPAYSMVHGCLWMERLGEALRGKVAVWFVYYGNDLYENLRPNFGRYRMPFVRRLPDGAGEAGWEIVTAHVHREPWPVNAPRLYLDRLAELCTPGPLAERAFSACEYLIARAGALTERVGAQLVVAGVPDALQLSAAGVEDLTRRLRRPAPLDPRAPDRALAGICEGLGIPFVALGDHLSVSDYYRSDCHWTASGHARVARVLEELHSAYHPVQPDRPARRVPPARRTAEPAARSAS